MEGDVYWASAEWDWTIEDDAEAADGKLNASDGSCRIPMMQPSGKDAEISGCSSTSAMASSSLEMDNGSVGGQAPQNWCEISLENEQGEGVEINELHGSGEPFSSANAKKDLETLKSCDAPASGSLAYQLGMMVVSKAAEVVQTVAESGDKKTHKEIEEEERMREKLERATARGEELLIELENAKQWITYHEGIEEGLNQQLSEANDRLVSVQKDSQLKLQANRVQNERLNSQMEALASHNRELEKDNEFKQKTVEELKQQVQLLNEKLTENATGKSTMRDGHVTTSCQTSSAEAIDSSVQCHLATSGGTEKQLQDTTAALETANARCDKMRRRLMSSLESMKAQTTQMRTSRVALEEALNETRDTKATLGDERLRRKETAQQLEETKQLADEANAQLEAMKHNVAYQESRIEEMSRHLEASETENREKTFQLTAHHLVQNCVRDARDEISLARKKEELQKAWMQCKNLRLQIEEEKSSKHKLECELAESRLKEQEQEEDLLQAKNEIKNFLQEVERRRKEIQLGEDAIRSLKITLEDRDREVENNRREYENLVILRTQEAEGLRRLILSLEEENQVLRRRLQQQESKTREAVKEQDDLSQRLRAKTEHFESSLSQAKHNNETINSELGLARQKNANLQRQLEEAKANQDTLAKTTERLNKAEKRNAELQAVTEEDIRVISGYEHAIHNLREDCRGLDWICRDQHRRIAQLDWENRSLRAQLMRPVPRVAETEQNAFFDESEPPNKLDTIVETDERDSVSKTSSSGTPVSAVAPSATGEAGESETNKSQTRSDVRSSTSTAQSSTNGKEKGQRKIKTRDKVSAERRPHVPLWRRERSATPQVGHVPSSHATNGAESDDSVFRHARDEKCSRRLGIPMPEEQFNEIASNEATTLSAVAHKDIHDHVNLSHDDGYASSTCVTPHRRSRRSRRSSRSASSENHYYVTYDGVTLDLASFSMAQMRQMTSTCPSTSTTDGMDAFFEFLARKADELNSDPAWRGRHTLGEASDWLQLRGVYQ